MRWQWYSRAQGKGVPPIIPQGFCMPLSAPIPLSVLSPRASIPRAFSARVSNDQPVMITVHDVFTSGELAS